MTYTAYASVDPNHAEIAIPCSEKPVVGSKILYRGVWLTVNSYRDSAGNWIRK